MLFNSYIWTLYKNSEEGKKNIEGFRTSSREMLKNYFGLDELIYLIDDEKTALLLEKREIMVFLTDHIQNFAANVSVVSQSDAENLYTQLIGRGKS